MSRLGRNDYNQIVPVADHDPLPRDRGALFLKVEFVAPTGVRLPGCLSAPTRHFAAVFVGPSGFYFNQAVPPLQSELDDIFRLIPDLSGKIFPLRYETTFHFAGEPPIAGSFCSPMP
jgi:hypothetical protein